MDLASQHKHNSTTRDRRDALPPGNYQKYTHVYKRRYVTYTLVGFCVAVFLIQLAVGLPNAMGRFPSRESLIFHVLFELSPGGLNAGYLWQPLTHIFLHGNFAHIVVNMLCLASTGPWLERQMGRWHFLAIFFLGGLVGGLAQIGVSGGGVVGASSGLYAVVLALVTLNPRAQMHLLLFFLIPVRLRADLLGWGLILSSLVLEITGLFPIMGHVAHLGGGLAGWAYIMCYNLATGRNLRERGPFSRDPARQQHIPWYNDNENDNAAPGDGVATERPAEDFAVVRDLQPIPVLRGGKPVVALPPAGALRLGRGHRSRPDAEPPARGESRPEAVSPPFRAQPRKGSAAPGADPALEAILDKVERDGIESLSARELRLLERGLQ